MRKRATRLNRLKKTLLLLAVLVCLYYGAVTLTPLPNWMANSLEVDPDLRAADVIVVLGGGVYENGELTFSALRRAVHAVGLKRRGLAPRLLFSGGRMEPELPAEAAGLAALAASLGVPPQGVFTDDRSRNTHGNIVEASRIMAEHGWRDALLVTDYFHMKRALLAARRLGVRVYPAPTVSLARVIDKPLERYRLYRQARHEILGIWAYRYLTPEILDGFPEWLRRMI